jgi:non-ribosomal peptide synthetase component F
VPLPFTAAQTKAVRELALSCQTSPAAVLLDLVGAAACRYHEVGELVLGVPVVQRDSVEAQRTVGPLLNVLPMRYRLIEGPSRHTAVQAGAAELARCIEHKDVSYRDILRAYRASGGRRGDLPVLHYFNLETQPARLRLVGVRCAVSPWRSPHSNLPS